MYTVKSTRVGKAKVYETIPEVLKEVERVLLDREKGMAWGRIVIEGGKGRRL